MAVRLNVLMVQDAPSGADSALGEQVVGEMIGRPGIDMMLVGQLQRISEDSTDHLTISGLSGDLAVLEWGPVDQSVTALAQLGCVGTRVPHPDDPEVASPSGPVRRIYGFDLRIAQSADHVCKALQGLLAARQVKTVQLGVVGTPVVPAGSADVPPQRSQPPVGVASVDPTKAVPNGPVGDHSDLASETSSVADPIKSEHSLSEGRDDAMPDFPGLDRLVDELDGLDL
ncbi:MAG: hypothetical protein AAGA03_09020 [Planctomycetota bacterium]